MAIATADTADLTKVDQAHLIHPLYHPTEHETPKIWVKGNGAVMTDVEGREYIDGMGGLWNVNAGHGRSELAKAAEAQMSAHAGLCAYRSALSLSI